MNEIKLVEDDDEVVFHQPVEIVTESFGSRSNYGRRISHPKKTKSKKKPRPSDLLLSSIQSKKTIPSDQSNYYVIQIMNL